MLKNTPVQEYKLKGKKVLVKRDDLMGDGNVLPPWGKMSGIDALLEKLNTKVTDFELDLDVGKLILDGTSVMYLAGMEVDYRKDIFGEKLMVENPNVQSMCGCGESFSPKDVVFTSGPYSPMGMDLTKNA